MLVQGPRGTAHVRRVLGCVQGGAGWLLSPAGGVSVVMHSAGSSGPDLCTLLMVPLPALLYQRFLQVPGL